MSDKPEVYYYPTPEQAEQVRNRIKHRHPESRVVEYQKGHAIQYHVSGPYYPELEEPRAIDRAVYLLTKKITRITGGAHREDAQDALGLINSTLIDVADRLNHAFGDLTGVLGADLKEARAIGRAKGNLELALMDLGLFAVMPPAPIPDNLDSFPSFLQGPWFLPHGPLFLP